MTAFVQQNSGTLQTLHHIYGFGQTLSIAVGALGTIQRWDGQRWRSVSSGTVQTLRKVWGASSAQIWVCGDGGTLLVSNDAGLTWSQVNTLNTVVGSAGKYVGLWGSSALDFWVIENVGGGFFHTTDGGVSWTQVIQIPGRWAHMWGSSSAYVIASGLTGVTGATASLLAQYNGSFWSQRSGATGYADGLGCWPNPTGPQNWSVGIGPTGALITDYLSFATGTTSARDNPFADALTYHGVYGSDPSTLLAVGADRSGNAAIGFLIPPAGTPATRSTWGNVTLPSTLPQGKGGLRSVYADVSGYAAAVGYAGAIVGRPGATLSLTSAVPVSTKTVRATLAAIPLAQSQIGIGDALNPQSWFIQRLDNGRRLTTIAVAAVSPTVYDVVIAERFGSSLVQHELSAANLLDPFGNQISAPSVQQFAGVVSDTEDTEEAKAAARRYVLTDIANPPFPIPGNNLGGGTRVISAAGDFASDSGNALLTKLILRRLGTSPGGFFHLPTYGLAIKVKEVLRTSDLVALKKNIEDQVKLEPEVEAVAAALQLDAANNILFIRLAVRTNTGKTFKVETKQSTAAVML